MWKRPRARAVLLSLLAIASVPSAAEEIGLAALQGTWRGRDTSNLRSVWTLRIDGARFRFQGPGPKEWYAGTVSLAAGDPAGIDLRITACECGYKDSTSLGIYGLQEDRLTFVGAEPGQERPRSFEVGERSLLMHLRRIEPSE